MLTSVLTSVLTAAGMQPGEAGLETLPDGPLEAIMHSLRLRDLASLGVCSKTLRDLVCRQPDALWQAAALQGPAYPRQVAASLSPGGPWQPLKTCLQGRSDTQGTLRPGSHALTATCARQPQGPRPAQLP